MKKNQQKSESNEAQASSQATDFTEIKKYLSPIMPGATDKEVEHFAQQLIAKLIEGLR